MRKEGVNFAKIPDAPGVYLFHGDQKGGILYIGKATSLRDRVRSYFAGDLATVRSPLVAKAVDDAVRVETRETDSVLDALILEAKLVREHRPSGNTELKDDKSWNWLVVTRETFPRFLIVRERDLSTRFALFPRHVQHLDVGQSKGMEAEGVLAVYGPFPRGGDLKEGLRIVGKIFPFFDTPFVVDRKLSKSQAKTLHFNQAIGKYPPLDVVAYKKTVRFMTLLFSAQKKTLLSTLETAMKRAAKAEHFEEAALLKRKLFALKHIQDITLIKEDLKRPEAGIFRVEGYDTAHLKGEAARAVMVVIENGEPVTSSYRTFTIGKLVQHLDVGQVAKEDDYAALEEALKRRVGHPEWGRPNLMVIDGGRAHLTRAKKVLAETALKHVPVVAVVKDERHRPREILGPIELRYTHEASILLANSEAHRFSIARHRRALRLSKSKK